MNIHAQFKCYKITTFWNLFFRENSVKTYQINIMDKFVHLSKPGIGVLITEILSHGPHDMICSGYISLQTEY